LDGERWGVYRNSDFRATSSNGENRPGDNDLAVIQLRPKPGVIIGRLLRTTKLSEISSPDDWNATGGPKMLQQGPDFTAGMENVDIVQVSGGHEKPVFYVGNQGQYNKSDPALFSNWLWRWASGPAWQRIVPAKNGSAKVARRFFVNPYVSNEIYIIDESAIKRSTDGGVHWNMDRELDMAVTENGRYSYDIMQISDNSNSVINSVINDMVFVPNEPTRFAVGNAGVFFSRDGKHWELLLSTRALPGHPAAAYFDPISDPADRALYVAFDGRSPLTISPIPRL
jgi:hypothetical protein